MGRDQRNETSPLGRRLRLPPAACPPRLFVVCRLPFEPPAPAAVSPAATLSAMKHERRRSGERQRRSRVVHADGGTLFERIK